MKPRTAGLLVGIVLVGAVLAAYGVLVLGISVKAPLPTRVAVTHSPLPPPPPSPARSQSPGSVAQSPTPVSQSPQARPPIQVQGAPQFNEFLRGIALLEAAGQGLTAEQARALLPAIKQFTSEGGGGIGYYNRFPAAQDAIWAALTDKQKDWLKQHKSDIKSQQGPPERTSGPPAEKLLKAIQSR